MSLDHLTFLYVRALLVQHKGNMTAVARTMGVDRRTIYRWIDRWERPGYPERPAVRGSKVNVESAAANAETFRALAEQ